VDFVRFSREHDIEANAVLGRGIAGLFRVAPEPCLPAGVRLLFERFLDINRREAPDIDIDFCQQRRGE